MPHISQHRPTKLTLQDVLDAKRAGTITGQQFTAMFGILQDRGEGATLSSEEASIIMAGGQVDDRGFLERHFGGIASTDPAEQGTFIRPTFDIPGTDIGVNLPTLIGGATLASLGIGGAGLSGAGGATAFGLSRAGTLGALRTGAPMVGRRAVGKLGVRPLGAAGATFGGGQLIGSTQLPPVLPDGEPAAPAQEGGGALGTKIAGLQGDELKLPDGEPTGPKGPIIRHPVKDAETGEVVPGQFFYTQDGVFVDPSDVQLTPDQQEQQFAFSQTREGAEFAAASRQEVAEFTAASKQEAADIKFGRDQQLAAFDRQRQESIRQGNFAEARTIVERQNAFLAAESKAQRDAAFVQALLPILASPGSRFRFAANVSRLGGGQAQFTPTEAFGRLFRFSGLEPGAAVPLTGEQGFSIIPNIQQFADLGPREREELEAIVGESTGRDLFGIGRQSSRLAPP